MIYRILEFLLKVTVFFYFKERQVSNRPSIPKGRPVMFVSNHPGAFMDPIVITTFAKKSLYFIARGESFKNKFAAYFFKLIHMIPVYRKEETPELTHKNKAVFGACSRHFEKGRAMLIFPEGTSKIEPRLRKVKSGAARIALGAEAQNDFNLDLIIVPVGLNYSNPKDFRTNVHVNFGDPIKVSAYQAAYKKDSFVTSKTLTRDIEASIKAQMLLIEKEEDDKVFEQIQSVYFKEMLDRLKVGKLTAEEELTLKNEVITAIDFFKNKFPDLSIRLSQMLKEYSAKLKVVQSKYPMFDHKVVEGKTSLIANFIGGIFGFPLFIVGALFNYLPYRLVGYFTNRYTQRDDFTGALRMVIGMFAFLFTYILFCIVGVNLISNWMIVAVIILLSPFLGLFSLVYLKMINRVKAELFFKKMILTENASIKKILTLRVQIIEELEEARLLYNKMEVNKN